MKKFSVYEIQGDVTPDELIAHITDSENVFRDFSSSLDTITGGFLPLYEEIDANGVMQPKYYVSIDGNLMTFAYKMLKKNVPAAQVKDVLGNPVARRACSRAQREERIETNGV